MAKKRVYGFDEAGYDRVQRAVRQTLGTPAAGARRRRQVPVLGGTAATTDSGGGGGHGMLDQECCRCIKGVALPGTPTVCCESSLIFEAVIWPGNTVHEFKYKPDDEWATSPDGFEDPETCEGYGYGEVANKYRWVRTPSHTLGADIVQLELVEDNGCPIKCAVYKAVTPLKCNCAQRFYLASFNNIPASQLPCDFCMGPRETRLESVPAIGGCFELDGDVVQLPGGFYTTISGASGPDTGSVGSGGGAFVYTLPNPDLCYSVSGLTFDVNINGTNLQTIVPAWLPSACRDGLDIMCGHRYGGPVQLHGPGVEFSPGWPAGTKCVAGPNGLDTLESVVIPHLIVIRVNPTTIGLKLITTITVPGSSVRMHYASDVFELDETTATQTDVDAIFDAAIFQTLCDDTEYQAAGFPGDMVPPTSIILRSASSAAALEADIEPTHDGACGTPCAAAAADPDPDPENTCCIDSECYEDMDETDCTEAGGEFMSDCADCEGLRPCCLGENCEQMTATACAAAGGTLGSGESCESCFPEGRCCDGVTCTVTTFAECSGDWSPYEGCGGVVCGQGACCSKDEDGHNCLCGIATEAECLGFDDGVYLGDNTTCADEACVEEAPNCAWDIEDV
jgi:hypothetical protein